MGNCLITKLNALIDNEELLKVGEMRVKVTGKTNDHSSVSSSNYNVALTSSVSQEVNILHGSQAGSGVTTVTVGTTRTYFNVEEGAVLSIPNKYAITELLVRSMSFDLSQITKYGIYTPLYYSYANNNSIGDISYLARIPNITDIRILVGGDLLTGDLNSLIDKVNTTRFVINEAVASQVATPNITGNLSAFSQWDKLTSLCIMSCPAITGSIMDLVNCTSLTSMIVRYMRGLTASAIEDFAVAQRTKRLAKRASIAGEQISCYGYYGLAGAFTFNGVMCSAKEHTITFADASPYITITDTVTTRIYDGSSWATV